MTQALWKFFTSLRLTVVCLTLGMILVFVGTLAQVNEGLWDAQARWFRAFFVWWHPGGGRIGLPVFPAGYLVGSVLLVNLVAAHLKRFTWSPKKIGIQLTHLGVILFLVGMLATDLLSEESLLSFTEGQSKSFSEAAREHELVFAEDAGDGQEKVVSVLNKAVAAAEGKSELAAPGLPCTVRVKEFHANGQILGRKQTLEASQKLNTALATVEAQYSTVEGLAPQAERATENPGRREVWEKALAAIGEKPTGDFAADARRLAADPVKGPRLCAELKTRFRAEMLARFGQSGGALAVAAERIQRGEALNAENLPAPATQGDGKDALAFPMAEGKDMDSRNLPYAVIELIESGRSLGTWLVSPWLDPQEVTIAGHAYRLAMRFVRVYHPFTTTLLKTTHELYPGTRIPKNYQSRVRINNPATGEAREVDIYMNNPLRYAGLTFYQYQMGEADQEGRPNSSTLQVVRNPGWITPYVACGLVGGGMMYQFLYHLIGFIGKRKRPTPLPA